MSSEKKSDKVKEILDKEPEIGYGVLAGAAIGSCIPVIGTGVGATIGGVIGIGAKIFRKNKKNK